jgi:hypothetical protein
MRSFFLVDPTRIVASEAGFTHLVIPSHHPVEASITVAVAAMVSARRLSLLSSVKQRDPSRTQQRSPRRVTELCSNQFERVNGTATIQFISRMHIIGGTLHRLEVRNYRSQRIEVMAEWKSRNIN